MNNINNILEDLYAIDEGLRQHEKELIKIINELLVSRPDTRFDQNFARQLRSELLTRAQEIRNNNSLQTKFNFNFKDMLDNLTIKRLAYAGAGVVVVVLALVFLQSTKTGILPSLNDDQLAFAPRITSMGRNAFGSLTQPVENKARPQSGGGGGADMALSRAVGLGGGGGMAGAVSPEAMIVPPDFVTYQYQYAGDDIVLSDDAVAVLKRIKGGATSAGLLPYLDKLGVDLNLRSFNNLQLQGLNVSEDKEFGYNIYISPMEGMISVSEQWDKWQGIYPKCQDENCWQNSRLKLEDVPADDELISMSNQFLSAHGIVLENYGQPSVENQWRVQYAQEQRPEFAWVPDAVTVHYPLVINGQTVYEEGGMPFGLTVNVNIRAKRVSGFWNYTTNVYQSSDYAAATDAAKVIKAAEQGGRYYYGWQSDGGRTETIQLGTPSRAYVKIWKYHEDTGINDELLVPALVFPVLDKPDNFYRDVITIPLAQELLDEYLQAPDGDQIPRPLMEPLPVEPAVDAMTPPAMTGEDAPVSSGAMDTQDVNK